MITRFAQLVVVLLVVAIGASFMTGWAASNVVPASSAGVDSHVPVPDDFKPPECAAIAIAGLVTGTGAFAGTGANDLILGSAAADTITSNAGDDCVLSGAGTDDLFAGTGGGFGGSSDVLNAGGDADRCRGEGGTATYISCESVAASLLGAWATGLVHAAPVGQSRALVFAGQMEAGGTETLTGVTYGGQAMTLVVGVGTTTASPRVTVEIWVLGEAGIAAAADGTIVPTWTAAPTSEHYSSAFFGDVNQGALTGATQTNVGNGGSPLTTAALASTWGDIALFAVATSNTPTFTPNNGFIEGTDENGGSALETAYQPSTGADLTPSTTPSANPGRWAMVGAVLKSVTTP
jgi:hypothetical protein